MCYPCSLGWLSPTTLAAFFLIYVAPCEFSSSSTSTLKDMVSGEGRCLLRLNKTERSGKHTAFEYFSKAKYIYSQQPGVKQRKCLPSSQNETCDLPAETSVILLYKTATFEDTLWPCLDPRASMQRWAGPACGRLSCFVSTAAPGHWWPLSYGRISACSWQPLAPERGGSQTPAESR